MRMLWIATVCGMIGWAVVFVFIGLVNQPKADWLVISGASHHFGPGKYNETNTGLGVEINVNEDLSVLAGGYRNSYEKESYYLGAGYTPIRIGQIRLGAVAGLFTGYVKKVTPVAMGLIAWEGNKYGLNLLYLPKYRDFDGLVAAQLKVRF